MKISVLIPLLVMLTGCSTIMSGTTQQVSVNSNIQGADVTIDGVSLGRTPVMNARIKRKDSSFMMVKKEGYKDAQQVLNTRLDNWFWGNFIIGGFLGSTTDMASGTTHLLDPNTLFVQMEPINGAVLKDPAQSDKSSELRVFVTNSYSSLIKNIKNGEGEYLISLYRLMAVEENEKAGMLKKLRSMVTLYDSVHEFAEEVVRLFEKKKK